MSTERVEINPDNNNKTLEQSQEDLAKQGVNVNEGVVNIPYTPPSASCNSLATKLTSVAVTLSA